jgi:hypothetical protein
MHNHNIINLLPAPKFYANPFIPICTFDCYCDTPKPELIFYTTRRIQGFIVWGDLSAETSDWHNYPPGIMLWILDSLEKIIVQKT